MVKQTDLQHRALRTPADDPLKWIKSLAERLTGLSIRHRAHALRSETQPVSQRVRGIRSFQAQRRADAIIITVEVSSHTEYLHVAAWPVLEGITKCGPAVFAIEQADDGATFLARIRLPVTDDLSYVHQVQLTEQIQALHQLALFLARPEVTTADVSKLKAQWATTGMDYIPPLPAGLQSKPWVKKVMSDLRFPIEALLGGLSAIITIDDNPLLEKFVLSTLSTMLHQRVRSIGKSLLYGVHPHLLASQLGDAPGSIAINASQLDYSSGGIPATALERLFVRAYALDKPVIIMGETTYSSEHAVQASCHREADLSDLIAFGLTYYNRAPAELSTTQLAALRDKITEAVRLEEDPDWIAVEALIRRCLVMERHEQQHLSDAATFLMRLKQT